MSESERIDAESLAKHFNENIAKAEGAKVIVNSDEFKMLDLDSQRNSEKWTIIGGSTIVPSDLEIAANLSSELPMIDIEGIELDRNLVGIKVKHGGFQLKLLSQSQGLSVDTIDESDTIKDHIEFDPTISKEQRYTVDLHDSLRAMLYLGPDRYTMRVFQKQKDGETFIRMIFNPTVPKE